MAVGTARSTAGIGYVPTPPAGQEGASLPTVPAQRLRKPSWRDPRLAIGLVLVLLSVVLGSVVVTAADETQPAFAAARALAPGDAIGPDDVRVVQVKVDDLTRTYLSAGEPLPEGAVVTRSVGEGELVPRGAVGDVDAVAVRPVGVPFDGPLPRGLGKGAVVDVWVAAPNPERAGTFLRPEPLVEGAVVSEVSESGGALGAGGATTVQVLVTADQLPEVLGAIANGAAVSLVLLPGAGS